jgi:FkbM family methyltransferase
MTNDNFSIVDCVITENQAVKLDFKLLNNEFSNKNIKIKFSDPKFYVSLYWYNACFSKDVIYWAAFLLPYSDTVCIEVFHENEKIFYKTVQLKKEQDLFLLKKFPYLLNYYDQYIDKTIVSEIFCENIYESKITPLNKNDVVVDIGSNVGGFIYYAMKHKASKIYCCEPNIECINILKNHFDIYPHIFINNYAISDRTEEKNLMLLDDTDGRNFILTDQEIHSNYKIQKIQGIDFLNFIELNDIKFIDFLKIDCEGGEHYIFTDKNESFICENVNKIVLEYHGQCQKIINFFEKNNFIYEIKYFSEDSGMIYAKNLKYNNKFIEK